MEDCIENCTEKLPRENYYEKELNSYYERIEQKRGEKLTNGQKELIRLIFDDSSLMYTDYESGYRFNLKIEEIFSDISVYDFFVKKLFSDRTKIATKEQEIKLVKSKISGIIEKFKQERTLFFP